MSEVLPYLIEHIQLDIMPEMTFKKQTYFVFWWRTIPLGHLFFDAPTQPFVIAIKKQILIIIADTIDQYSSHKNQLVKYRTAFLNNDLIIFSTIMDEIFSIYLLKKIPFKVPVSVIICTRNRSLSLEKCINSLLVQHCMPEEIIVVDNSPSDDGTLKICKQFSSVIYCAEMKLGLDFARNTGARLASKQIIAYVDDDVLVHADWCYRVWETFINPSVSAVTGLIIASNLNTESQQIFEKHWGFNKGYKKIKFDNSFLRSAVPKVWDIGAGANMAFRKTILEKLNYFDERLDVGAAGCSGDSEIWYRMLLLNYTIQYNPLVIAYHAHRVTIAELHKQLYQYMRGSVVAAFIQHSYTKNSGYKKYVYYELPKYYLLLLRLGFPNYPFRYKTIFTEIKGIIAGVKFYNRIK